MEHHLVRTKLGTMVSTSIQRATSPSNLALPLIVKLAFSPSSLVHQVTLFFNVLNEPLARSRSSCIALSHVAVRSRVTIQNTVVAGAITPNDCENKVDTSSRNVRLADKAVPTVALNSTTKKSTGRVGIVFPTISRFNNVPLRPWTDITYYPCRKFTHRKRNSMLVINDLF